MPRTYQMLWDPALIQFPLSVSSNGRYLQTPSGTPFPLFTESGWEHGRLQTAGWQSYLNEIAARGYTASFLQGPMSYVWDQTDAYNNPWFDGRSGNTWDLTKPNAANFANQRAAADYAAAKGVAEFYWPCYAGYQGTGEGIIDALRALTGAQAQAYGAYIGALMNSAPNVIYVLGGDHFLTGANKLSSADLELYRRLMVGILSTDRPGRIATWHAARGESSYELDNITAGYIASLGVPFFDFAYCREATTFAAAHQQCLTPYAAGRAVAMLEGSYENGTIANADATVLRRQTWGTWLSGGCGHAFGDEQRFLFESGWESTLSRTGLAHDKIAIDYIKSIEWWKLVPSTGSGLVTSGGGTINTAGYKPRAVTSDGKLALCENTDGTLTVFDKSKLSGSFAANWVDPTVPNTRVAIGTNIANSGTQSYATPGLNAAGGPDWIWEAKVPG